MWEHTRLINYALYCANTADKIKPSIKDYMPLLTDMPDKKAEPISVDDQLRIQELAKNRLAMLQK